MKDINKSIEKEIDEITSLHKKGLFKKALEKTDNLYNSNPSNSLIFNAYGVIYAGLKNFEKSINYFLKAIKIEPKYIKAHNNIASVLTYLGRFEEASKFYIQIIKFKPDYSEAYFNLGKLFFKLGKHEASIDNYTKTIELKPDHYEARVNLIKILTYYNPNKKNLNSYVLTNNLLQSTKFNFKSEKEISDNSISDFFYNCNEIVNKNINNLNTEEVQIFRRNAFKFNCERHFEVFDTYKIIPENCFSCYKVQIDLKTVVELFKLYFVFDNLNLKDNNTRKCMIELRENVSGMYKGYIYCRSLDEANSIENQLKKILSKTIVKNFLVKVKRGCTEFGVLYPEYKDIKKNMKYDEKWRDKEKIVDEKLKDQSVKIVPSNFENLTGTTLRDVLIMYNWLSYAKKVGDLSYKKIFENITISPTIENLFTDKLSKRSREFDYVY